MSRHCVTPVLMYYPPQRNRTIFKVNYMANENIETEFARQLNNLGLYGSDKEKAKPDTTKHTPAVNNALNETDKGNSDSLAWGDLLTEFSQLPAERTSAALKRLTPNALSSIEDTIRRVKPQVKERALEKAKLYLLQQGIAASDMVAFLQGGRVTTPPSLDMVGVKGEPTGRKKRATNRPWYSKAAKEIKEYLTSHPTNLDKPTGLIVDMYRTTYPDLTSTDVSRIKYELKVKLGITKK